MPNVFISVKEIARQTLPRLIENLVFPNLIHKDFSNDFVKGKGNKIQVRKPVILEAKDFNTNVEMQDLKEESVEVTLDKLATVDVEYGSIESCTSVDDLNRLFIEPAAIALAEKINRDGLELYKDIPYTSGVAGTTPKGLADIANVRKTLNQQKVPFANRRAVWDTEADASFTTVDAIVNAEKSGTTQALREGAIGRVFGLDNYMSQAVKRHTSGTLAASAVVKTQANPGESTLALTVESGNKVVAGDILVIDKQNYVVLQDANAVGTDLSVKVYPAVDKQIKNNAKVTLIASHTANLAFNPGAFAFVTRPLVAPSGVESYVTSYNGITLRVVKGYDMKTKKEMISMDVLYGYHTMYPELAVRVLG